MNAVINTVNGAPRAIAVIMHGGATTKEQHQLQVVASALSQHGCLCVRVDALDDLGYGDEALQGMTLTKRIENLEDTITWVQQQTWCTAPLIIGGHSLGAFAAGIVAASLNASQSEASGDHSALQNDVAGKFSFAGAILMAPAISGDFLWKSRGSAELADAQTRGHSVREMKAYPGKSFKINYEFFDDALNYSLLRSAAALRRLPVLIIVGAHDVVTPPEDAKLLVHALGTAATYVEIPDTKHNFRGKEDVLANHIDTWVQNTIL